MKDSAAFTDEVEITLNDAEISSLAVDAKGPVDAYRQAMADGSERLIDRSGNDIDETDSFVQVEAYPGQYGGPVPTDPEGEPE